jgi:hypothetical protein
MSLYKKRSAPADDIPRMDYSSTTGLWSVWDYGTQSKVEFASWLGIVDFPSVRTLWRKFDGSGPPEIVWDKIAGQSGPAPSKDKEWRHGIAVVVYSGELDGLRRITTTTVGLCEQLSDRYDEWEQNPAGKAAGNLPLIQTGALEEYTNPRGTFFDPNLEIIDYVSRPPELPETPPPPPDPLAGTAIVGLDKDIDDDIPY